MIHEPVKTVPFAGKLRVVVTYHQPYRYGRSDRVYHYLLGVELSDGSYATVYRSRMGCESAANAEKKARDYARRHPEAVTLAERIGEERIARYAAAVEERRANDGR